MKLVRGPSGAGLDDLYTPEVTNVGGLDNTVSVICTHGTTTSRRSVSSTRSMGSPTTVSRRGCPKGVWHGLPGCQRRPESLPRHTGSLLHQLNDRADAARLSGQPGGYIDGSGTPTEVLSYALDAVDADLGLIVEALRQRNLYESTLIIVTAKHGQSPINPRKINKPGHFADLVAGLTAAKQR